MNPTESCENAALTPEETAACRNLLMNIYGANSFDQRLLVDYSRELQNTVDHLLSTLTPREERILRSVLLEGRTLVEMKFAFNMELEDVESCFKKGLRKMRHPSRTKQIRPFLTPLDRED